MLINNSRVTLAITGASGSAYAMRLLECLLGAGVTVYLLISGAAHVVFAQEMQLHLPTGAKATEEFLTERFQAGTAQLRVLELDDWFSAPASGSNAPSAMVICPCSGGTLSAIAHGASDNLIERAADVMIKEGRKLIVVPREAPVSVVYLENLLTLARLGVVVLPASPGFYHRPKTVADLVDFIVSRLLDHLGVTQTLVARWGN